MAKKTKYRKATTLIVFVPKEPNQFCDDIFLARIKSIVREYNAVYFEHGSFILDTSNKKTTARVNHLNGK